MKFFYRYVHTLWGLVMKNLPRNLHLLLSKDYKKKKQKSTNFGIYICALSEFDLMKTSILQLAEVVYLKVIQVKMPKNQKLVIAYCRNVVCHKWSSLSKSTISH